MNSIAPTAHASAIEPRGLRLFIYREPVLAWLTLVVLAFIPILLVLLGIDERQTNDINVWVKPLKFHIATAVFSGTLAWYCGWIDRTVMSRLWYRGYVYLIVTCVAIELSWLWAAAFLGEPSHFNRTHPILAPTYPIMGTVAVTLTTSALFVGWLVAVNKHSTLSNYFRYSVVASLVISFIFTVYIAGELASMDSHWIDGTRSDANGLGLFGWSRDGGDLRVAHFFALHGMQLIPLAALMPLPKQLVARPLASALILSVVYIAFMMYTYIQAKMGMPFLGWLTVG